MSGAPYHFKFMRATDMGESQSRFLGGYLIRFEIM